MTDLAAVSGGSPWVAVNQLQKDHGRTQCVSVYTQVWQQTDWLSYLAFDHIQGCL